MSYINYYTKTQVQYFIMIQCHCENEIDNFVSKKLPSAQRNNCNGEYETQSFALVLDQKQSPLSAAI